MDKQIIIDGVQFNKWGDFLIDYELSGTYKTISSSDKCYKILKSLIEQLKRKEKECEKLKEILIHIRKRLYITKDDITSHHLTKTACKHLIDCINEVI